MTMKMQLLAIDMNNRKINGIIVVGKDERVWGNVKKFKRNSDAVTGSQKDGQKS